MMKKLSLVIVMIAMVLFAGCSSDKPQITNVIDVDMKYNEDKGRIDYKLKIDYAINSDLEQPTSGLMKVKFDEDDFTKEEEWVLLAGQRNADVSIGFGYSDYEIGHEITGTVEMVHGTEVISEKPFKVVYNE